METLSAAQRVVVLGGGPGGAEAALSAAQLGADVTLVERTGVGGSAVLTDVVPSKTLIATAESAAAIRDAHQLGVQFFLRGDDGRASRPQVAVNLKAVNQRLLRLAAQQSADMRRVLEQAGVRISEGHGRLDGPNRVIVSTTAGGTDFDELEADTIVISVGGSPRTLPAAQPDGQRILTWKQVYNLEEMPEHLIVVGSGVTGAEFASAFSIMGAPVTLVSSRDRVLPGEDADAAQVLEAVFKGHGMTVLGQSRAEGAKVVDGGVEVSLADGRVLEGSHALFAVGSIPNTADLALETAGVATDESGRVKVNRVARTNVPNIYAVGDCSDALPLASVAAMQGRTAIYHALGDTANPIVLRRVASNIFTQPEIATVGWQQKDLEEGIAKGDVEVVHLAANARAKMMGVEEGFVKLFAQPGSGTVIGGVIVSPKASELIYPVAMAVEHRLTVDEVARTFSIYPSLAGSIQDAARALHRVVD